jgi:hypothetical protein
MYLPSIYSPQHMKDFGAASLCAHGFLDFCPASGGNDYIKLAVPVSLGLCSLRRSIESLAYLSML